MLDAIQIEMHQGAETLSFLPTMHQFCAEGLKGFPYYYAPPSAQKINPTDTIYINEPQSELILAYHEEEIVGMTTGLPLNSFYLGRDYFTSDLAELFKEPDQIWYVGYFLLKERFRHNRPLYEGMFKQLCQSARDHGKSMLCFVDVNRGEFPSDLLENQTHPEPWGDLIKNFIPAGVSFNAVWPTFQPDASIELKPHVVDFYLININEKN